MESRLQFMQPNGHGLSGDLSGRAVCDAPGIAFRFRKIHSRSDHSARRPIACDTEIAMKSPSSSIARTLTSARLPVLALFVALLSPTLVLAQTIFKINTLTANNPTVVDATAQLHDDRGGIVVSPSKVFLVGDDTSLPDNANATIWSRADLSSPGAVGASRASRHRPI